MAPTANGKNVFSHDIAAETRDAFKAFCEAEGIVQRRAIERILHLFMALSAEQRRFVMRGKEEEYRRWLQEIAAPPVPDHPDAELEEAAKRAELEEAAKRAEREQADKRARRRKG